MKGLRFLDGFLIPLITRVDMHTRVQRQKRLQDEAKKSKPKKNRAFDYLGQEYGPPPERGPQPQGMNEGGMGGCPHRDNGVKSDIKGISNIQVKGKKFIGIR